MYKAVAIDLDGTLLRSDGSISSRTARALSALKKRGLPVIVCTGRNLSEVEDVLDFDAICPIMVLLTGALVIDVQTGEKLYGDFIDANVAVDILKTLRNEPNCFFYVYSGKHLYAFPEARRALYRCGLNQKDLECTERWLVCDEYLDTKIAEGEIVCEKIFLITNDLERMDRTIHSFSERVECIGAGVGKIEIISKDNDKATGLAVALKQLNLCRNQVLAFGDSKNDLPLARACKTFVAMGNADPELSEISDMQTETNDKDGVAKTIEDMIQNEKL